VNDRNRLIPSLSSSLNRFQRFVERSAVEGTEKSERVGTVYAGGDEVRGERDK